MDKRVERVLILLIDFITVNLAWMLYFLLRVETGWFDLIIEPEFLIPMFAIYLYWVIVFTFVGMYRTWFAASRFDELSTLFKASFVGVFILFFLILFDDYSHGEASTNRFIIFIYWGLMLASVGFGRIFIRSVQRNLLKNGIGRRNALIIGYNPKAHEVHDSIKKYRALGLDVVAYVAVRKENIGKDYKGIKVVKNVDSLETTIDDFDVRNIIIALEKHEDDVLMNVLSKCEGKNVSIKIVPDLYDIISGQARTRQIYGFPLIDIMPELMPEWEKKVKRILDIIVSLIIILVTAPMTIATSIAIKLDSKGPVFYKQERMGQKGKNFNILKFRSMVTDAEKLSGPVWSAKDDPRVTKVGHFIRKVRIDEIPQMFNILKGEMSLVGPRPERPYFVEKLTQEIPLYKRRLKVRPGVTGWAQVKHKYDESIDDVKTKLRYDLFYIENMSLRMDLNILFRTVFVVLFGKGHFE